jgi:hypothetical protein
MALGLLSLPPEGVYIWAATGVSQLIPDGTVSVMEDEEQNTGPDGNGGNTKNYTFVFANRKS